MSETRVIKIILRYLENLKKAGIEIDLVYLYGSFARNEADENSDIDVALISSIFDECDDSKRAKVWSLSIRQDHRIEPYTIGLNKFNSDNFSPIIQIIKKEGKIIYQN